MRLLILKPNWIAITKKKGITPSVPKNLNAVLNNLTEFEIKGNVIRFKHSDYPMIPTKKWLNPHSTTAGIHRDCLKKIIELGD